MSRNRKHGGVGKRFLTVLLTLAMIVSLTPSLGVLTGGSLGAQEAYADIEYKTLEYNGMVYECPAVCAGRNYGENSLAVMGYKGWNTTVTIPGNIILGGVNYTVVGIGQDAFDPNEETGNGNTVNPNISKIIIPSTLKFIDYGGIAHLDHLTELKIPAGIEILESGAIYGCPNLKKITILSTSPNVYYGYQYGGCIPSNSGLKVYGVKLRNSRFDGDVLPGQDYCEENGIEYLGLPPNNPRWDGTTMRWDPPEASVDISHYYIHVYKDDKPCSSWSTQFQDDPTALSSPMANFMAAHGNGAYKFRLSYHEKTGGMSATSDYSPEYNYTGPLNQYTLTFDPGDGSGTMASITVEGGTQINLPACTFTPPSSDKNFKCWKDYHYKTYPAGQPYTVTSNETFTAVWKDKSEQDLIWSAELPDVTIPAARPDYTNNPGAGIRLKNTGNQSISMPNVTISGPDASCFSFSHTYGNTIPAGEDSVLGMISVKSGLPVGTYTATITFTCDSPLPPMTATVTFTVRDHIFDTSTWKYNTEVHWNPCTDLACTAHGNEAPHDSNNVTPGTAPTFDADGVTGDIFCSVCGRKMSSGQPLPALKYILESKATLTPASITADLCRNDLAISSDNPGRYTAAITGAYDLTDTSLNTYGPSRFYPPDKKFISGHKYGIVINFNAVAPYEYYENGDHMERWSSFAVNGAEAPKNSSAMFDSSSVRMIELVASGSAKTDLGEEDAAGHVTAGGLTDRTYTGSEIRPVPSVSVSGKTLTRGTDYDLSYSNNINVGTATVTITGKGDYTGTITRTFTILPASTSVADANVEAIPDQTFTYSEIRPDLVVKFGGSPLVKDKDYTLTYKNNINVGTATITITGKGSYTGTKSVTFRIIDAPAAKTFTLGGNKMTFKNNVYTGIRLPSKARPYQLTLTARFDKKMLIQWTDCKKQGANIDGYIILRRVGSETGYTEYVRTTTPQINYYYDAAIPKANTNYYYIVLGYKNVNGKTVVSSDSMSVVGVRYDSTKINPHECPAKGVSAALQAKFGLPTINKTAITLRVGQTYDLKLTYPKLSFSTWTRWRSETSSVARINSAGRVTAVTPGTSLISGRTPNGRDIRCVVTVKP